MKKYSVLIIAAVMLVAMAFAGAASALDSYTDGTVKLYVNNSGTWELDEKSLGDVRAIYNSSAIGYKITSLDDLQNIGTGSDIYILTQDIYCTTPTDSAIIETFQGTLIGNGYTIYNLTIHADTANIGLVDTLWEHGTLNYVNLTCANISSSSKSVGGLVGYADSASNVTGCTVMHSDVTGSGGVGGLVGVANSASLKIQNCSVENCTASSSYYVGGLVGFADSASVVSCDVKNCVVSSSSDVVGGLVGYAGSAHTNFLSCDVKNCVIASGSNNVGGLVGGAASASFSECSAENCTVSGSYNVGGLVGHAISASFSGCTAKDCAVAGTQPSVNQLAGNGDATGANPAENVIVDNTTTAIQINLTRVGGNPSEYHMVDSKLTPAVSSPETFFKTLVSGESYGYAYKSYDNTSDPRVHITSLGAYGTEGGFGYFSVTDPTIHYGITITNATGSYELTSALTKVYGDDGNGYANLTEANPATGTYTLELHGFNASCSGKPIINASVANLTIVLNGESNLTGSFAGSEKGLLLSSGNLTIKGTDDTSKLLVNNTNSPIQSAVVISISAAQYLTIDNAKVTAIANSYGNGDANALVGAYSFTITGSKTIVNANATSTSHSAYSILSMKDIKIESGAKVIADAHGFSETYALDSLGGNVSIGSSAVVEANAISTSGSAYSIYATVQNIIIDSAKKVNATAETEGSDKDAYGLYAAGIGNITITDSPDVTVIANATTGKTYAILLDNTKNGDLTIGISNSTVTANATTVSGEIYTIYANPGNITISDSANVTVNANSNSGKVYGILADRKKNDFGVLTIDSSTVDASVNSNNNASVTICGQNELNILDSEVKSEATGLSESQNPASATTAIASLSSQNGLVTIDSSTVTVDVLEKNTDSDKGIAVGIYANEGLNVNNSEIDVDVGPTGYMNGGFMLSSYTNKINISGDSTKISVNASAPSMIGIGFFSYNGFTIENCTRIFANGSTTSFGYYPSGSHDITALSSGYSFHNASLTSTEEPCSYTRFNDDWTTVTSPMSAKLSNYSKVLITKEDMSTSYGITITNKTGSYPLTSALTKVYGDDGSGYANLSVIDTATGTYTLELNGFNATNAGHTDQPIINASVANLTIKLVGESNLTGSYADSEKGLLYAEGNLTITDSGKLLVNNTNSPLAETGVDSIYAKYLTIDDAKVTAIANNYGMGDACGIMGVNNVTITGSKTVVDANATSADSVAYSICSIKDIQIDSSANVNANTQGSSNTYALYSMIGNVSIGSSTIVEANATSTSKTAYSIIAWNITIEDGATVTATANASDQGEAYAIISDCCLIVNESAVTAKAKGGHEYVEALGANTIVVSGENTVIEATAIDTNKTYAAYAFSGLESLSIISVKKITAIASSVYRNASSFAYGENGACDFTGLATGYTFSNATSSGAAPTSYAIFNDSNNWHIIYDETNHTASNYKAVTIQKGSTPTPTPSSGSSSSKHSGYTQILSQGQVVPTTTPTVAPTAAPTTVVNPTAKATTQATTQPTQSSPAPVAGLIAGLGAAALVLSRLRR